MKPIQIRILALVLLAGMVMASPAFGYSYYVWGDGAPNWHDADKTRAHDDDDAMCWAGAAANILSWGGWGTADYQTEDEIFKKINHHMINQGNYPVIAWKWWLNGLGKYTKYSVDVPGGGDYWPSYNYSDYYLWGGECWKSLPYISSFLHQGYGVTLVVHKYGGGAHALTVWGYDYTGSGRGTDYTGIYVTNSDDYTNQLAHYSLSWDDAKDKWNLGGGFSGWYAGGVEALAPRPTPAPAALPLLASGLVGVWFRKRTPKRD
ncbi:MAG: hypothetical protein V2A77_01920 [Pseudomonadota bacterium]